MIHHPGLCAVALAIAVGVSWAAAADVSLSEMRPHPRLFAGDGDLERVRALVASDTTAREWHEKLRARGVALLAQPPVEYRLIGPRLLHVSREALSRISTLALLYRLDGERAFADRAVTELAAVCAFPDWHPAHFLDTAEMTHGVAIGYDWLYDALTPEQRAAIKEAIIEKGLRPALTCYEGGAWWVTSPFNWNQVCNGGIAIGALAIADEEPQIGADVLSRARASVPRSLEEYEPDGGWAEGPGYWDYATRYAVYVLAALNSALGTDLGLSEQPGLARTGDFRIHSVGPLEQTFNYADASASAGPAAEMFWLARRYGRPDYARHERRRPGARSPFDLLWYEPADDAPLDLPLDKAFRRVEVAFFRSAWDDPNATFIGFKGGDNKANHSHLDLGTFVLDALGRRWAVDLGADDYNLPGYFGRERWRYYRLRTEGHNTLTIDGENQDAGARAPLIGFASAPERAFAVADLSAAYPQAQRVRRGIALVGRTHVLIQDEVEAAAPVDLVWTMHTAAEVAVGGASAALTLDGRTMHARILSPEGAEFATASADPGPPQRRNEGVTRLVIRLPKTSSVRLAVVLSPDAGAPLGALSPLNEWLAVAPTSR